MRIWRLNELGNPIDVLRLEEAPDPTPREGEVLVDVDAVGLSFPDVLQCQGKYQVKTPIPFTPGGEYAGTVTAVGAGADSAVVGRKVMVMGGTGLADKATARATMVFPFPDHLDPAKMAAIPVNYGTTLFALHDRAHLQSGETLLVTGAAGGTGSSAIQLGKAAGARVIAIAGGEDKVALAKQLGADDVIDHRVAPDFVDAVRELTNGKGVDVCYDPVGGDTFKMCQRCMAWDGRLLVIGFVAGIPQIATNHILLKNYAIVGVHWGASLAKFPDSGPNQMRTLVTMAESGTVDPLLYPPFAMEGAAQALQLINDRGVWGKAIVRIEH
jgi:NADPH2:quinone reductase